jgi:hypothetical protein
LTQVFVWRGARPGAATVGVRFFEQYNPDTSA